MRGTFANIRLRNQLVARHARAAWTRAPAGRRGDDDLRRGDALPGRGRAARSCIAGKEYGTGSSRDWAAKGTLLLGVRAVIAESFERIHRSQPRGDGRAAAAVHAGRGRESLGLTGREVVLDQRHRRTATPSEVTVRADDKEFRARVRLDTPQELEYLRHGGILQFVLRRLLAAG